MKSSETAQRFIYLFIAGSLALASCRKEGSSDANTSITSTTTSATIAVAASAGTSVASASSDSVYVVQPCARGSRRDSIAEASLPTTVTEYLTTNYPAYTFSRAYAITNSAGTTTGYVAIIYYNEKPVGIEFDSSGNFIRVLEQREKGDLQGTGWHHGGRFEDRSGTGKDTVALSTIPTAIQAYMSSNFSTDTLIKALRNRDSSYVIFSVSNGLYATSFDAEGNFLKRIDLSSRPGKSSAIAEASLPANVLDYLSTTYPNYSFKKAFVIISSNTDKRYVVVIDANNTKYAAAFDASGNFIAVKTIY